MTGLGRGMMLQSQRKLTVKSIYEY